MAGEMNLRIYCKLKYRHEHIKFCTSDAEGDLSTCLRHLNILLNHCIQIQRQTFAFYLPHGGRWFYFLNAGYRILSVAEIIPTISSTLMFCTSPLSDFVTPHPTLDPGMDTLSALCQESLDRPEKCPSFSKEDWD